MQERKKLKHSYVNLQHKELMMMKNQSSGNTVIGEDITGINGEICNRGFPLQNRPGK